MRNSYERIAMHEKELTEATGQSVYLDIPTSNSAAVALVQQYDAAYVFECARIYLGTAPKVELQKIFGVTTFELG